MSKMVHDMLRSRRAAIASRGASTFCILVLTSSLFVACSEAPSSDLPNFDDAQVSGDTSESVETTDPVDTTEPVETTDPVDTFDPVDTTDPFDTTDPADTSDPDTSTGSDFVSAFSASLSADCCGWIDYGYLDEAACTADTESLVSEYCLTMQWAELPANLADCVLTATQSLRECALAAAVGCDLAARDQCWETWSTAALDCGPTDWYGELCPAPIEQLSCDGGTTTYSDFQGCDGFADCDDGTDEFDCFSCPDALVIRADYVCDGTPDCGAPGEAADELDCFACDDESMNVIPPSWQCDGVTDCDNGADETPSVCYSCSDGVLIPQSFVCDGYPDCPSPTGEPEDENDCFGYPCSSGGEVNWDSVCNGTADCADGSDEPAWCEAPLDYECRDGSKIPAEWQCDGYLDCTDGLDERCGYVCQNSAGPEQVPSELACDGTSDCEDGLDELCFSCVTSNSSLGESRSFPAAWRCDGVFDCVEGEDEANCSGSTYRCLSGADVLGGLGEIASDQLCDGAEDCTSGEDETWCSICGSGVGQRNAVQLCDGVLDCLDASDEFESLCNPASVPTEPPADCVELAALACDGVPNDCPGNIDEIGCDSNRCLDSDLPFPDAFRCDGFPDCFDDSDENGCTSG